MDPTRTWTLYSVDMISPIARQPCAQCDSQLAVLERVIELDSDRSRSGDEPGEGLRSSRIAVQLMTRTVDASTAEGKHLVLDRDDGKTVRF
jgi:hypothetical protein